MTRRLLTRIITDARLTPDAVRMILYVESKGAGWHPIDSPEFKATIFNGRGEKPIRAAYENAAYCGWLDRRRGEGRAFVYCFRTPEEGGDSVSPQGEETPGLPSQTGEKKPVSVSQMGETNDREEGSEDSLSQRGETTDLVSPRGESNPPPRAGASPLGETTNYVGDEGGGEGAGARTEGRLAEDAGELIAAEASALGPIAPALQSYLPRRVPPARQHGYVRTVIGYLGGCMPVHGPDGTPIRGSPLQTLVAQALTDLEASDERMMAGQVGEPRNLWTKLLVLANPETPKRPHGSSGNGRRSRPAGREGGRGAAASAGGEGGGRRVRLTSEG